jgi:hypothetical protein
VEDAGDGGPASGSFDEKSALMEKLAVHFSDLT